MKLVIDIPEELYNNIQKDCGIYPYRLVYDAMKNGTPLPTDAVDRVTIKEYLDSYNEVKTELEPCEDAISKQAVLELIADYNLSMGQVVRGIHALPPVTPQPKMGRWEKHDVRGQRVDCCSVCGLSNGTIYEYNYCPNCGAKMEDAE